MERSTQQSGFIQKVESKIQEHSETFFGEGMNTFQEHFMQQ